MKFNIFLPTFLSVSTISLDFVQGFQFFSPWDFDYFYIIFIIINIIFFGASRQESTIYPLFVLHQVIPLISCIETSPRALPVAAPLPSVGVAGFSIAMVVWVIMLRRRRGKNNICDQRTTRWGSEQIGPN